MKKGTKDAIIVGGVGLAAAGAVLAARKRRMAHRMGPAEINHDDLSGMQTTTEEILTGSVEDVLPQGDPPKMSDMSSPRKIEETFLREERRTTTDLSE